MASINPSHSPMSLETPVPERKVSIGSGVTKNHVMVDVMLRAMLSATALVAIIVTVTSKQTKLIPVAPGLAIPLAAKFTHSPAFIYFIVALSVACFYGLTTGFLSVLALVKSTSRSTKMLFHLVIFDTLVFGIMATATGAAAGVGYIAYEGNDHTRWNKICNIYGTFCRHIAGSIAVSVFPSVALLLLVWVSVYVLSKKIGRS